MERPNPMASKERNKVDSLRYLYNIQIIFRDMPERTVSQCVSEQIRGCGTCGIKEMISGRPGTQM